MKKAEVVLHDGQITAVHVLEENGSKKDVTYQVVDTHGNVFTVGGKQRVKDYYRMCRLEFIVADAMNARAIRFGSVN